MRQTLVAVGAMFLAAYAEASIATPTLPGLAQRSSSIATGKVLLVLPTPFSPVILLVAAALFASAVFVRSWRSGRRLRAAILGVLVLFGALAGVVVFMGTTTHAVYQNVAFVRVERTHRGPIHGIVPVFFRTSFVCDISAMERGQRYVLFVNSSAIGYQPSWYDWSIWRVSNGSVRTERLAWRGGTDTSYDAFVSSISAALVQRDTASLLMGTAAAE